MLNAIVFTSLTMMCFQAVATESSLPPPEQSFIGDRIDLSLAVSGIDTEEGLLSVLGGVRDDATIRVEAERIREHVLLTAFGCILPPASESPASDTASWWRKTLDGDVKRTASAWLHLASTYDLSDLEKPDSMPDRLRPCLAEALTKSLFDVLGALERERDRAAMRRKEGPPRSIAPPEGLPARAAPHLVQDPEARKDYEERLAQMDEYNAAGEDITVFNSMAHDLTALSGHPVRKLIRSLSPPERQEFQQSVIESRKKGEFVDKFVEMWLADLDSEDGD